MQLTTNLIIMTRYMSLVANNQLRLFLTLIRVTQLSTFITHDMLPNFLIREIRAKRFVGKFFFNPYNSKSRLTLKFGIVAPVTL
jgi:hypothetical protein